MSNKIKSFKLLIDNTKVVDAQYGKDIVKQHLFKLPYEIFNTFFVSNPNLLKEQEVILNWSTSNVNHQQKIEEIISNIYFRMKHSKNRSRLNSIEEIMINSTLLSPNKKLIKFNWFNNSQILNIPTILKKLCNINSNT